MSKAELAAELERMLDQGVTPLEALAQLGQWGVDLGEASKVMREVGHQRIANGRGWGQTLNLVAGQSQQPPDLSPEPVS